MNEDKVRRLKEELVVSVVGRPRVANAMEYRYIRDKRTVLDAEIQKLVEKFKPKTVEED
jgi:hypothetical protein